MRAKLALITMILLLGGCSHFVTAPEVAVRGVTVTSLDTAGLEMDIFLTVTNPNSYAVTLLGNSYQVQLLDLPLLKGGDRVRRDFPPKMATDLRLPLRISYHDLLDILRRSPDPERIPYQLQAGLDLDTPLGRLTIPLEKRSTFAIPKQYRPSNILRRLGDIFLGQ